MADYYGLARKKTQRLLLDWANLPEPISENWKGMVKNYPGVLGFSNDEKIKEIIGEVRALLRLAWKAPDIRLREWFLFAARQEYNTAFLGTMPFSRRNIERLLAIVGGEGLRPYLNVRKLLTLTPPPIESAFDRAVPDVKRMAICEARDCEEPLFLRGPKRERYCPDCKRPARLRTKKKYWHEKGKYNRKGKKSLC